MSKRKDSIYKKVKQNWQRQCADVREHNKKIKDREKEAFVYIFLFVAETNAACFHGLYLGEHTYTVDLRKALPSIFLRPCSQHGWIVRGIDKNYDFNKNIACVIRMSVSLAMEMLGNGTLLSQENFFPPYTVDQGLKILLQRQEGAMLDSELSKLLPPNTSALLVGALGLGVKGAAWATVLSQAAGAIIPVIYFARKNKSLLHFCKTRFYGKVLLESCSNGSSEFVSNVSSSLVGMLFNFQLLKLAGENGVSAYGVLMYVNFIYVAIFLGYSIGVAPVVGYHYGAKNHDELKNLFKKSLILMAVAGVALTALAEALAAPLSKLFVGYDAELYELTKHAFYVYSLCFVFTGVNIFGSGFFTALSNGKVSAIISFLRTVVFQVAAVLLLPQIIGGVGGVWWSVAVAEVLSFAVTVFCFLRYRKKYDYV